jgi:hypothetical protein
MVLVDCWCSCSHIRFDNVITPASPDFNSYSAFMQPAVCLQQFPISQPPSQDTARGMSTTGYIFGLDTAGGLAHSSSRLAIVDQLGGNVPVSMFRSRPLRNRKACRSINAHGSHHWYWCRPAFAAASTSMPVFHMRSQSCSVSAVLPTKTGLVADLAWQKGVRCCNNSMQHAHLLNCRDMGMLQSVGGTSGNPTRPLSAVTNYWMGFTPLLHHSRILLCLRFGLGDELQQQS